LKGEIKSRTVAVRKGPKTTKAWVALRTAIVGRIWRPGLGGDREKLVGLSQKYRLENFKH